MEIVGAALKDLKTNHPEDYRRLIEDVTPGLFKDVEEKNKIREGLSTLGTQIFRIVRLAKYVLTTTNQIYVYTYCVPWSPTYIQFVPCNF